MTAKKPPLSIVVACHNEEQNILPLMKRFLVTYKKLPFELIIVNDGSTDATESVIKKTLKNSQYKFAKLVTYPKNKGYGRAILTGLKTAKANILAWTHADLQTDPMDVVAAYQKFIHSPLERKIIKGRRISRPLGPTLFTFFMSLVASVVFGRAISDINAQPKLFDRKFYEKLTNPPSDFSLDLYLLVMAKKLGYSTLTVPVRFGKRIHGQSKWATSFRSRIKTIWRTIKYIFRLRRQLSPENTGYDTPILVLTLCVAAIIGMQITHFWQWPSIDILPVIARFRDPNFLLNDLYTNINGAFSARFYFAHLVDIVSQLFRSDPAVMISYLNPVVFAVAGYGLYRFARGITLPVIIAALSTILILSGLTPQPTLGLWKFVVPQFVPSWSAAALIVVAIAMAQRNKLWATATALIAASFFHPTTTLVATPLVATIYLIDEQKRYLADKGKHWLILIFVIAFVVSIFFFVPSRILTNNQKLPPVDSATFYHLYVEIRHPHHYLASAWPREDWQRFIIYSLAWFGLVVILKKQKQPRWIVDNAAILATFNVAAVLGHLVLVNGLHNRVTTILSPIRLIGIIWPFFLIFGAKALYNLQPIKSFVDGVTDIRLKSGPVLILVVALLGFYGNSFRTNIRAEKSRFIASNQQFYNCIQEKLPADAQVVIHPQFDSIAFRVMAKRAVYGDDVFPFNERFVSAWWQQYTTVHGETKVNEIATLYDQLTYNQTTRINQQSGAQFFLVSRNAIDGDQVLCDNPNYKLIKVSYYAKGNFF